MNKFGMMLICTIAFVTMFYRSTEAQEDICHMIRKFQSESQQKSGMQVGIIVEKLNGKLEYITSDFGQAQSKATPEEALSRSISLINLQHLNIGRVVVLCSDDEYGALVCELFGDPPGFKDCGQSHCFGEDGSYWALYRYDKKKGTWIESELGISSGWKEQGVWVTDSKGLLHEGDLIGFQWTKSVLSGTDPESGDPLYKAEIKGAFKKRCNQ